MSHSHLMNGESKIWPCVLGGFAVGGALGLGLAHLIRPSWCGAAKRVAGKPTLYTNPVCPFAHRAWMTLVEKGVAFDTVLIPLSGELTRFQKEGKTSGIWATKTVGEVEKIKADYKATINATGEVPTLTIAGIIVSEADVVCEFIDDNWKQGPTLWPACPVQRARARQMYKIMSGGPGISALYGLLMNQDPAKDEEFRQKIYKHHEKFAELADPTGPFFLGHTPSFMDVMLAPFYYRFQALLPHYRGIAFFPPVDAAPWVARMHVWAKAIEALPSFEATKGLSTDVLVTYYIGYAGARGQSKPL